MKLIERYFSDPEGGKLNGKNIPESAIIRSTTSSQGAEENYETNMLILFDRGNI
jgi:hypothetical protein